METEIVAGINNWQAQPLSDRFLKKNKVKVGFEFEVCYDVSDLRDNGTQDDDFYDEEAEEEATASDDGSRLQFEDKIKDVIIRADSLHADEDIDYEAFYRSLAFQFFMYLPNEKIISMAASYNFYRSLPNKYSGWNFTYDSSISGGFPVEIVSPIMDASDNLEGKLKGLWTFFKMSQAETNESTGLHVTMSCAEGTRYFNVLVFALLSGDQDILARFSRTDNDYAQSTTARIYRLIGLGYSPDDDEVAEKLNELLTEADDIFNELDDGERYRSVNLTKINDGIIEYRGIGDDYIHLTTPDKLAKIVRRLASSFALACDPKVLDNENLASWLRKKLYLGLKGIRSTTEYKKKFAKQSTGSIRENFTFRESLNANEVMQGSLQYKYGKVQAGDGQSYQVNLSYSDSTWVIDKVTVVPKATETKESTLAVARSLYTLLASLTNNVLPKSAKATVMNDAVGVGKLSDVSKQLVAKLNLAGKSIGEIVRDAVLAEADKRMWRLAKIDPEAYQRTIKIKMLADTAQSVRDTYSLMDKDVYKRFVVNLIQDARPDAGQSVPDLALAVWSRDNLSAKDYIDASLATSFGVPLDSIKERLSRSMVDAMGDIRYYCRREEENRAAQKLMVWQRKAAYMAQGSDKSYMLKALKELLAAFKAIGASYPTELDSNLEAAIDTAWVKVQEVIASIVAENPKLKYLAPGAVSEDSVMDIAMEL